MQLNNNDNTSDNNKNYQANPAVESQPKQEEPEVAHPVWEVIKFFLLATIIVAPIRMFIAQPFIVSGASMAPTFATSQYLIVDQLSYRFEEPQRGDVIILKYPKNPSQYFIKRIIGLPGETVSIVNGEVLITKPGNEVPLTLDEPYVSDSNKKLDENLIEELADDEYYVMGDNRGGSLDSRSWGPLNERFIVGHAMLRLFPVSKAEFSPGQGVDYAE